MSHIMETILIDMLGGSRVRLRAHGHQMRPSGAGQLDCIRRGQWRQSVLSRNRFRIMHCDECLVSAVAPQRHLPPTGQRPSDDIGASRTDILAHISYVGTERLRFRNAIGSHLTITGR